MTTTTLQERTRIARELHDTLLQGIQGLILRMHAVALTYPPSDIERQRLDSIVIAAEQVLQETRDCILGLREPASGDLVNALNSIPLEFNKWRRQEVQISCEGTPRKLRAQVADTIRSICREALVNAARHSTGNLARVGVRYAPQWLEVAIEDNGIVRSQRPAARARARSWGLVGMVERAAKVNGKLHLAHRSRQGLKITLRIPGTAAYE